MAPQGVRHRHEDDEGGDGKIININRSVSIWQIGAVIVTLIIQATATVLTLNTMGERIKTLSDDVTKLAAANNQSMLDRKDVSFELKTLSQRIDEMGRRIATLEARPTR